MSGTWKASSFIRLLSCSALTSRAAEVYCLGWSSASGCPQSPRSSRSPFLLRGASGLAASPAAALPQDRGCGRRKCALAPGLAASQGPGFYCHEVHFLHVVGFTELQTNKAPIEKSVKVHTKNRSSRRRVQLRDLLQELDATQTCCFALGFAVQAEKSSSSSQRNPGPSVCVQESSSSALSVDILGMLIWKLTYSVS